MNAPNFEHPLPVLDVSIEALHIETNDTSTGELTVKNSGGGMLAGCVSARHDALRFEPTRWEGNVQTLRYTFDPALADTNANGMFETMAYISTNGGEVALPVTARQAQMTITTHDGTRIANVREFYEFALLHPASARQIFTSSEFYMLLLAVEYPYMDIYENLHKDANRERALDNFFILSGMKRKTSLVLSKTTFHFDHRPNDPTKRLGHIPVEKSDAGYNEAAIVAETAPPWLTFNAERLASADFDADYRARILFTIDPAKISTRYVRERVYIDGHEAEITFRRLPPLQAKLSKDSFRYDDHGFIEITNHTGADLPVEVSCADSFVRFKAKAYLVGAQYQIPFTVKLSAFTNAGRFFRKAPFMCTTIEIKGTRPGFVHKLTIPLSAGEW